MRMLVVLTVLTVTVPIRGQQEDEVRSSIQISAALRAGNDFAVAWNDWSKQHSPYTTSLEDKARFAKVKKLWHRFEGLAKDVE